MDEQLTEIKRAKNITYKENDHEEMPIPDDTYTVSFLFVLVMTVLENNED